ILLAVCALLAFGIPALIAAMPPSLINVPNKDHWLAPEHREETNEYFRSAMAWFGCALMTFLLVVNQLVFNANQSNPHHLNGPQFTVALFVFLGFVAIWTVRLVFHFATLPDVPGSPQ